MACENNQRLLNGYFDDELDLERSLEFEDHLKACAECANELAELKLMRLGLQSASLFEHAPDSLRTRIRSNIPRKKTWGIIEWPQPSMQWFAFAAAILIAALLGATVLRQMERRDVTSENLLSQEILSSHLRSLQPGHLYDVESTDQHTVKPWFDGKVDFAPSVIDLANQGFPLIGGRLDYLNHRSVAALVYRRQKHLINVFVWPDEPAQSKLPDTQSLQGYNLRFWKHNGMSYCAVSDLNASELGQFAQMLQQ